MVQTVILNATSGTFNRDATSSGNEVNLLDGSTEVAGADGRTNPSSGSAFYNQEITLNSDFTMTFTATVTGVDGFVVVLHNDADGAGALGGIGRDIGAGGIYDGIGVEFDTYRNRPRTGGDEANDNHSNIVDTDGAIYNSSANISNPNNNLPVDLNDGAPHSYQIDWDASTRTLTWTIDGQQIGSQTFTEAELDQYLTADRSVYVGVTSGNFLDGDAQLKDVTLTGGFVCIHGEALIETDQGDVLMKELQIGDYVRTDRGTHEAIRWIGSRQLTRADMLANPKLFPVRIKAGALGQGLPVRDLLVSRQHRMKVSSKISQRVVDSADVLIPAFRLVGLPGIEVATDVDGVSYYHVLCDNHEVIFADAAPTETLLPGAEALKVMSAEQREEIHAIFPDLRIIGGNWRPAFPIPEPRHQKRIVARHLKNNKALLAFAA
jgi:hypothetical protein